MYKVVKDFPEKYDNGRWYLVGRDGYPRKGFVPPDGRAEALCAAVISPMNKTGEVYLELVEKPEPKKPPKPKE